MEPITGEVERENRGTMGRKMEKYQHKESRSKDQTVNDGVAHSRIGT